MTALITFLEITSLNSIPQPFVSKPPTLTPRKQASADFWVVDKYTVSHAFCVASASIGYLIWADIGNALTNHKTYFWMDPKIVGSRESVMLYGCGFVGLSGAGESPG